MMTEMSGAAAGGCFTIFTRGRGLRTYLSEREQRALTWLRSRYQFWAIPALERLFQISDDVFRSFDTDGNSDQIVADAHTLALFGGEIAMRSHRGIEHHGMDVAKRGSADDHLEPFHEAENFVPAGVLQGDGDHGAVEILREQARDGGGIGMRGVAREVDFFDAGMRCEPGSDFAGVGALALDAEAHGLDAAHGEIGLEWAHIRTGSSRERFDDIEVSFIGDDDSAEDVAVARHVLGRAVDRHRGSKLQGADDEGSGEGVIDDQRRSGGLGDFGDFVHLAHTEQRIRDGLHHDGAGPGFLNRSLYLVEVADVGVGCVDTKGSQNIVKHVRSGSVHSAGGDDSLWAIDQSGHERKLERGHTGGAGEGAVAAFEFVDQFLKSVRRGIVVAGVAGALLFPAEDAVELAHRIIKITRRGVDRRGDGDVVAGLLTIAGMNELAFEFHDRFHLTPSLVSSRMTPLAASSARISSARLKFLEFLAATRSATSLSISSSLSPPLETEAFNTSKTASKRARNSLAPMTLSERNSPASIAVFTSRMYSKAAPRASAVLRSSSRASSKAFSAAPVRSAIFGFIPAANRAVSRRSLKLRRRSMEVAAALRPSNVKFSFLR